MHEAMIKKQFCGSAAARERRRVYSEKRCAKCGRAELLAAAARVVEIWKGPFPVSEMAGPMAQLSAALAKAGAPTP